VFSFRQKILITYLIVFLLFLGLLFPLTKKAVEEIVRYQLEYRAYEMINNVNSSPNTATMIHRLRQLEPTLFSRITVLNAKGGVLYDSHTEKLLGNQFIKGYPTTHPEVVEALEKGTGYSEGYSSILGQEFVYVAIRFNFHGSYLVMRTAFPYEHVIDLIRDFQWGFLVFGTVILVLFGFLTWLSVHYLSRPIQSIISAVKPYQEGKQEHIPVIVLEKQTNSSDDFVRLAQTLNSLTEKIQHQIDTLTIERNEKSAILESLVEGVIAVDEDLNVLYANNMAINLFDIERHELLLYPLSKHKDHFNWELISSSHFLLDRCQKEKKIFSETLEIGQQGKKVYFDTVVAPKDEGAILVLQDKTSHYGILEMRKNFVAYASHELKTPITIIRGFAETLHDNPGLSTHIVGDVMGKIVRNCERMDTLVRNLLRLADVENLPLSQLTECHLLEVIEACQQMLSSVYPKATLTIEKLSDGPFFLIADSDLLELAFRNLFENAAKYSKEDGKIVVTIELLGDFIEVKVKDQGMGIPEEDIEHIFHKFYTVNKAHSRKLGGSGLGLSLVETIINKHKGNISVTSKVGVGSVFTLQLPVKMVDIEDI
jgi:two-component system, OmpR family, phosphate regulon sensor histidine kinase PhoR